MNNRSNSRTDRRRFMHLAGLSVAGLAVARSFGAAPIGRAKLRKALKYSMIDEGDTPLAKLELIKELGFEGVEIDSPSDLDLDALKGASEKTSIIVHGVIDSVHWKKTHCLSHPDPAVRAKGVAALETAIAEAKKVGADTALLVPGVCRTEEFEGKKHEVTYDECFERSQAEVKKVIPKAEAAGVKIAIEVVWNNFITKPEQLIEYVDAFKSESVGAYFDASNMLRYGVSSADWILKLGKRMLKLDFKGYSRKKAEEAGNPGAGFSVGIGEGDEDWPAVLAACAEVGYASWFTAEVNGGKRDHLADVSKRMDKILAG